MYKNRALKLYNHVKQEDMSTAVQQAAKPAESVSEGGLKGLLHQSLEAKSDEEIAALQRTINVAITSLLNALSSPFTVPVENFLAEMQQVIAGNPVSMSECTRSHAFYFGQIYALAELAGTVRQMKVPMEAAQVALNRSDSHPILSQVVEHDAITKAGLATALGKPSQNLHAVLQELEECGLIRRDEVGRSVVYSPTPLTRVCLTWMEQTEAATGT